MKIAIPLDTSPIRRWLAERWGLAALTILMAAGLPLGLSAGKWLAAPDVLWIAGLLALPIGLGLSVIVRRTGVFVALAALTGLLFTIQYHSQALPAPGPALTELAAGGRWIGAEAAGQIQSLTQGVPGATAPPPAFPEWQAAGERLSLYAWNLQGDWPTQAGQQLIRIGPNLLASLLGFSVWLVTALSVWVVARRRSVWAALLPLIAVLTISGYTNVRGWPYLILSMTAGLLLTAHLSNQRLLTRWQADSLPYGIEVDRWAWASAIATAVALSMLLAVRLTDPETRRWIDDTFFPKQPVEPSKGGSSPGSSAPRLGVMPTQHLLGSGPELSEQTVMHVRTPGVAPAGFYWRGSAYDAYTGHGWIASATGEVPTGSLPLWPDSPEPPENFALVRQTYRLEFATGQIYAVARPVRLNQPARGTWLAVTGGDLLSVQPLMAQSAYEVLSWAPVATPEDLRAASTEYPDWVTAAYLPLPEELPKRVTALAREVTAEAETPYDKALALQSYLRTYPYTLDLEAPPTDRDVVDYFLFDIKRGYCDYYATAMAVLARSAGLPARLAVGYATGEYDRESDSFRVSRADSHAWPEIYFPGYGWIAFEPTSSLPVPVRGELAAGWVSEAETAREENIHSFPSGNSTGAAGPAWGLIIVLGGASGAAVAVIGASLYRQRRRRQGEPRQIIGGLYHDLAAAGRRLGISTPEAQTPDELLAALLAEVEGRAGRAPEWSGSWASRQAYVSREAGELVRQYTHMMYSPRSPAKWSALNAADAWPGLSRTLWAFWLIGLVEPRRRGG